jgi:L-asparaginase
MVDGPRGLGASADSLDAIASAARAACPDLEIEAQTPFPPADSAEFDPATWRQLADAVTRAAAGAAGVVVIHGTDTLAYTASFLTLAAGALGVPVVLTGAMSPLSPSNPAARDNLALAVRAASELDAGVWIAFGGQVLPGFGARKLSLAREDAFAVANRSFATAGPGTAGDPPSVPVPLVGRIEALIGRPMTTPAPRVVLATAYPGFGGGELLALASGPGGALAAGVVLQTYGAGAAPVGRSGLAEAIAQLTEAGSLVVAVSQCVEGEIDLTRYATGRALAEAGATGAGGLAPEAAFALINYGFVIGLKASQLRRLLAGGDPAGR